MKTKTSIFLLSVMAAACILSSCKVDKGDDISSSAGSIYGSVTDLATGEPIAAAGVELVQTGQKTITGSDGQYTLSQISDGNYTVSVAKAGYTSGVKAVTVQNGQSTKVDIQLIKKSQALCIIDAYGREITSLEFGTGVTDTKTFSIFNNGTSALTWSITENCRWISTVSPKSGTLAAGEQEPVLVTIDRSAAGTDYTAYVLNINSDKGSAELNITVGELLNPPVVTTNAVTNVTSSTATLNGTIVSVGDPTYTERGFVLAQTAQPTIGANIGVYPCNVSGSLTFSAEALNLTPTTTYYVRAYAINTLGVVYGDAMSFKTATSATIEWDGPRTIAFSITNCTASGGQCIVDYDITNNGNDINSFYIGKYNETQAWDNLGNTYSNDMFDSSTFDRFKFPEEMTFHRQIIINNFNKNATSLRIDMIMRIDDTYQNCNLHIKNLPVNRE